MPQFITACASSRAGLLNRRLKSVRAASVDTAGNFAVEIQLIKYIGPFFTVESYSHERWRTVAIADISHWHEYPKQLVAINYYNVHNSS